MKPLSILRKAFSFLILLLFAGRVCYAQGTLKFYENKYVVLSGSAVGQNVMQLVASQNLVVSTGHVLKVENIVGVNTVGGNVYSINLSVDDIIYSSAISTNVVGNANVAFPVWLPAGTYSLKLNCSPSSANMVFVKAAFSAIDFQITP